jgi:hypothetical protein
MNSPSNTIPDHQKKRLLALLIENEFPVWMGQPDPLKIVETKTFGLGSILVIAGVAFGGFLMFLWIGSISSSPLTEMYSLVAVFFFVIGVVLIPVLYVMEGWIAKEYLYAITNQRVLILLPLLFSDHVQVFSYGRREIAELKIQAEPDGSGNLLFRQEGVGFGQLRFGFFHIPNVREVRKILMDTFEFEEHDFWSQ